MRSAKTDNKLQDVNNESVELSDKDLDVVSGGTVIGEDAYNAEMAKGDHASKLAEAESLNKG